MTLLKELDAISTYEARDYTIKLTTKVEFLTDRARLLFEKLGQSDFKATCKMKHDLSTVTETQIRNEAIDHTMKILASWISDINYPTIHGIRHYAIGAYVLGYDKEYEPITRGEIKLNEDFKILIESVEFYEYEREPFSLDEIKKL